MKGDAQKIRDKEIENMSLRTNNCRHHGVQVFKNVFELTSTQISSFTEQPYRYSPQIFR